jgi:DNA-binding MarR family transcriptional regulator
MPKKSKISTEQELEDALLMFHHRMQQELKSEAARFKISSSQLEVLRYVAEGSPTMKSIAERLKITPPSVTTIIDVLVKRGLLKRESSTKDRRIIKIILTLKAWKFFTKLKDQKLTILQNIFNELKQNDKKELIRLLSILSKK